jgi:hypothetical protein
MGCFKKSDLLTEKNIARDMWMSPKLHDSARTIEKWGFTDDRGLWKKFFEKATGKPHEIGIKMEASDYIKMQLYIQEQAELMRDPKNMSSDSVFKRLYIGRAKARLNPLLGNFYEAIRHASGYRTKHVNTMTSNFNDMINKFMDSIIEYDGFSAEHPMLEKIPGVKRYQAGKVFKTLNKKEQAYIINLKSGGKKGDRSASKDWGNIEAYLAGEGAVFQDFVDLVTDGSDGALKDKYREFENKGQYSNSLNQAMAAWRNIQEHGRKLTIDSLNQLSDQKKTDNNSGILEMKFGVGNKFVNKIAEEYKSIAKQLTEFEGGYIPHYVLDLFAGANEMREMMVETNNNPSKMEPFFRNYITQLESVNTNLIGRLKGRSKEQVEPFSRNPLLYADKYIAEVVRFNHSTFVEKAFVSGLKQFTEVILGNPGTAEAKAAKVYLEVFQEMFRDSKGLYGKETSHAEKNLDATVNALYYFSKIGASSRSPVRNAFQRIHHLTLFGLSEWNASRRAKKNDSYDKMLTIEKDKHGFQFQDISKVTEGALDEVDFRALGIDYKEGMLTDSDSRSIGNLVAKWSQKLATASAQNFNIPGLQKISMAHVEFGNRSNGFDLAFYHRYNQLKNTDKYKDVVLARNKEGEFIDPRVKRLATEAGTYAEKIVEFVHGDYSTAGKADILKKKYGRFGFKFVHYKMFFLDFMNKLYKDAKRSVKAGDWNGPQVQKMLYLGAIQAIAEAGSLIGNFNLTTYMGNELVEQVKEAAKLFTGTEEEQEEAFYGGGIPSAIGAVPVVDFTRVFNAGVAHGLWKHFINPHSMVGKYVGFRDLDHMDDDEFQQELLRTGWVEGGRLVSTFSTFAKHGVWPAIRQEFGLYPGQTALGIDTRKTRKKIQESEAYKKVSETYEKAFGIGLMPKETKRISLTDQQRRKALSSLASW